MSRADLIDLAILAFAVLCLLFGIFLAWKLLVLIAKGIVAVDAALFGRERITARTMPAVADFDREPAQVTGEPRTGLTVHFKYIDQAGEPSERSVYVESVELQGPGRARMITGQCRIAKARRSFLTARMRDAFDVKTGEIISNPSVWFAGG